MNQSGLLQEAVRSIIRPYRLSYKRTDLGPMWFKKLDSQYTRQDFYLLNPRKQKIRCSLFKSKNSKNGILIYLHGSSGCRLEGISIAQHILNQLDFLVFDFPGCGISDGDYITLGYYQHCDVQLVYKFCVYKLNYDRILIWGRSMGAAAALRFIEAFEPNKVVGVALDSAYINIKQIIEHVIKNYHNFPRVVSSVFTNLLLDRIEQKLKLNLRQVDLEPNLVKIFTPLLLIGCRTDTVVPFQHSLKIYDRAATNSKSILQITEAHNAYRSQQCIQSIVRFLKSKAVSKAPLYIYKSLRGVQKFFRGCNLNERLKEARKTSQNYRRPKSSYS